MSSAADYHLLSTVRRDAQLLDVSWNTVAHAGTPSPYLLLAYHCDRLVEAARTHGWPVPANLTLSGLEDLCNDASRTGSARLEGRTGDSYRIRILLSHTGALSVTASPTAPLPLPDPMVASLWLPSTSDPNPPYFGLETLVVHIDTIPTPSSIFTRTKTTRRDHYTAARGRCNIPPPPTTSLTEVLLYNEDGDVTETSIRNIAFVRRSPPCWVTPSASTGCLPGVVRRWLLGQGRVVSAGEGELKRTDIVDGEYVLTFNGVEGCRLGRISLAK
ncbi:aminotransferase [Cerioporus squamosus]|nr:aminotransferase [Cerioporus squamosus]